MTLLIGATVQPKRANVLDDEARKRLSNLATEFDRIALRVEDRMNKPNDGD
jgi:hypothetical protein